MSYSVLVVMLYVYTCDISTCSFFFNDTATTEIYTLSLHDALPISEIRVTVGVTEEMVAGLHERRFDLALITLPVPEDNRSEEHTSELQSLRHLVCRLLLEKKKKKTLNYFEKLVEQNSFGTCKRQMT